MIKYYRISLDSREDDLSTVADHNLNDVDIRKFWKAKKLKETAATGMDLFVSKGNIKETDFMANSLSILIFSKRLLNILLPLIKDDVQIFDAPLINNERMENIKDFYIVHPFKEYKCIDTDKTRHIHPENNENAFIPVGPLVLNNEEIPKDVHIFRAKENNDLKIVTNSFFKLFVNNKIQGAVFFECKLI